MGGFYIAKMFANAFKQKEWCACRRDCLFTRARETDESIECIVYVLNEEKESAHAHVHIHASKQASVCMWYQMKMCLVFQFALSFRPKTNIKTNEDVKQLTCKVKMAFNSFYLAVQKKVTKKKNTPHAFGQNGRTHICLHKYIFLACIEALSFPHRFILILFFVFFFIWFNVIAACDLFVSLYHWIFLSLFFHCILISKLFFLLLFVEFFFFVENAHSSRVWQWK